MRPVAIVHAVTSFARMTSISVLLTLALLLVLVLATLTVSAGSLNVGRTSIADLPSISTQATP